jgi:competence ComEA-like helix-hairpin-helix protein
MRLKNYLVAMGLSLLLAMPVVAQTTSPSKSPSPPAATPPSSPTTAAPSTTAKPTGKSEKTEELVDINSATAEELTKLSGVGPVRAQAIIANRPYNGKDDLTNRKIIPANVYNGIKEKIIARQK